MTGDVSAEVVCTDYHGILKEAEELIKIDPKIVLKVPVIIEWVKAKKELAGQGIKTNFTLVFSAEQALLAAKAGATYVPPFVGRLDDISIDGIQLIKRSVEIYRNYDFKTEVLAA